MSNFVERAMRTPVSPDLLAAAMEAIAELPQDQRRSFEGRAFRLFRLLEERDEGDDAALFAFVIQLRLEALARLHDDRGLRAWTLPARRHLRTWPMAPPVSAPPRKSRLNS